MICFLCAASTASPISIPIWRTSASPSAPWRSFLKRHAIDILHGDERFAADFSDFVDLADVGVVERGGGACLSKKTLASRFVFLKFFGQEFEGDVAIQRAVLGKEHFTHPAST